MKRSSDVFDFGSIVLPYTDQYKYLGLKLDEHMTFSSVRGGRALGSVQNKVKQCGNLGFHTYTQLYNSRVLSLTMLLVFCERASCNTVHHRAI